MLIMTAAQTFRPPEVVIVVDDDGDEASLGFSCPLVSPSLALSGLDLARLTRLATVTENRQKTKNKFDDTISHLCAGSLSCGVPAYYNLSLSS